MLSNRLLRNAKCVSDLKVNSAYSLLLQASQSTQATATTTAPTSNSEISPFVYNRNPRNLEHLRIARKPIGFALDANKRDYWHKLVLERSGQHITARVEHNTGKTVVSASTKEWAIKQHLVSTTDLRAAQAVGQVLTQRCLEAGMLELHCDYETSKASAKVQSILNALTQGGVALEEPPRYFPHRHFRNSLEPKPWTVTEPSE